MDRTELLSRVNARSGRRFGSPISPSQLDYLIEQHVLPGPKREQAGVPRPNYQHDQDALRTLTLIRWLRARGLHRNAQLRVYLWLAYFEVPFELFGNDLHYEFSRLRRRMVRGVSSTFDPAGGPPTERDMGTLNRQLGRLDSRLLPDGQTLAPLGIVDAYSLMRFGHSGSVEENMYRDLFDKLGLTPLVDEIGVGLFAFLNKCLAHSLATNHESDLSPEALISQIDRVACERARAVLDQLPWILTKGLQLLRSSRSTSFPVPEHLAPHFRIVARALLQPEFRISCFTQFALALWGSLRLRYSTRTC